MAGIPVVTLARIATRAAASAHTYLAGGAVTVDAALWGRRLAADTSRADFARAALRIVETGTTATCPASLGGGAVVSCTALRLDAAAALAEQ